MYYKSILPKIWTIKTQEWFYAFITSLTIFNKSYSWIRVTQNIPASLETTNSNDCWLDGEWTELGGCGNEGGEKRDNGVFIGKTQRELELGANLYESDRNS